MPMCYHATFNNISIISCTWQSVLWVEETWVPKENHRPVASHWQILSHNVVSSTLCHERDSNSQLIHHLYILILKYQVHVYYSRRKYANVLPRLIQLTKNKLALKIVSLTTMCSGRLGRDWHCLKLNEVIICQEHVVLRLMRGEWLLAPLSTIFQ
jgi:hypothetical protein